MGCKYQMLLAFGSLLAAVGLNGEFVGMGGYEEVISMVVAAAGLNLCFWTIARISVANQPSQTPD
ncbi:hypothetical protein CKO51_23390 [Rhodopirellula sp. SM50]|nr:hypothetical protein [Rhodopirellula sp. SM50]PAY17109.1 hypothetical protein CKO51_23390 [Rhodopirellula sp. SM50]